jgi:mRNA interferase MazF
MSFFYFMHIKKFLEWIGLKEKLHLKISSAPYVSEGEVWWASLGENIGAEINGKSRDFTRPVVIFRKLSHEFYLALPLTTKERYGTWYTKCNFLGKEQFVCLHQARSLDHRRLHSRLGELGAADIKAVRNGFQRLYL